MRLPARLGLLAACASLAPPLSAETVDATDPAKLVAVIQNLGYRASLGSDASGDPMIGSSVGGVEFGIYFYGCTKGESCTSLLFKVGYDREEGTALDIVEAWNERTLFGRAYLDEEGDPWVEMSVNMFGGVSRENFEDTYDWWEVVLDDFEKHIDRR